MGSIATHTPIYSIGAAVAVIKDDKVILNKAYGYANLEKQTLLDNSSQVFEWGSVTKLVTWVSVMQLVEEGRLDLNKDIKTYLPDNFLTKLKYEKPITLLNLMNHTAGFEDYLLDLGFKTPDSIKPLSEGLKLAEPDQVYEPGTVMSYSNFGAALAGYIVERASGMEFYEYANKNIFDPLGMKHTSIQPTLKDKKFLFDNKPMGYTWQGNNNFGLGSWTYVSLYPCGAANGTVADMAKFACAFMPKENESSPLFKNKNTLKELLSTSYSVVDGLPGVAHGLMEATNDKSILFHPGSTICFSSMLAFKPDERFAIIIASNQGSESQVVFGLTKELLFGKGVDVSTDIVTDYKDVTTAHTYLPARYQHGGYLEILGYMSYLNLDKVDNKTITLKQLGHGLVFTKKKNGIYTRDSDKDAIYLSVVDNKVEKFWLSGMEYVPAPKIRSEIWLVVSVITLVLSGLYFIIANIVGAIQWIVSFVKKKKKKLIYKLVALLNLCGLLMIINLILFFVRSLPWPDSSVVKIHIVFVYILSVGMIALIGFICKALRTSDLKKLQKVSIILANIIAVLFIIVIKYWGFYSIN